MHRQLIGHWRNPLLYSSCQSLSPWMVSGSTVHSKSLLLPRQSSTRHLRAAEQYEQKMTFTPYANWIIPGHLMLGRYPYIEPSRCQ